MAVGIGMLVQQTTYVDDTQMFFMTFRSYYLPK